MRLAFVSGLSDKKLAQKLAPLEALPRVDRIDLFRRRPYEGGKTRWVAQSPRFSGDPLRGDLWRLAALAARAGRYDVIVGCHQSYHGVLAWLAGALRRRPVIQLVIAEVDWVYRRPLLRPAMLAAGGCGVRGELGAARLRQLGYDRPIEVIANPFTPPPLSDAETEGKTYDLLAVGSYCPEKDYPWMLEVVARVRESLPHVKLAVAGEGPFRERLGGRASRLGVADNVEFVGWRQGADLDQLYRRSRCLLLTSREEGLPMVVVEAMAFGLCVFVTSRGELPWLVRDRVDGRVVEHGDTEGMASALVAALSDADSRARMSGNARRRVLELGDEFAVSRIAAHWDRLLDAVVVRGPPRRRRHRTA